MATKDRIATIELLEVIFSVRFVPRLYNEGQLSLEDREFGGGVEYLHLDPATRNRRRKGKSQI
jgi:hypothetical protein